MNKTLKIVFLIFIGFALVFGVMRISQTIKITNKIDNQEREQYSNALEEAKSRVLDNDEDGLMDWEEANAYQTSPYLQDTDSDGISDYDEIKQGTDPNCPEGKACGSGIIGEFERARAELDEEGRREEDLGNEEDLGDFEELNTDFSEESLKAMRALESGETPGADQIRALLRDSGIPPEQADKASDEDLIQLFKEVAEQTQAAQME